MSAPRARTSASPTDPVRARPASRGSLSRGGCTSPVNHPYGYCSTDGRATDERYVGSQPPSKEFKAHAFVHFQAAEAACEGGVGLHAHRAPHRARDHRHPARDRGSVVPRLQGPRRARRPRRPTSAQPFRPQRRYYADNGSYASVNLTRTGGDRPGRPLTSASGTSSHVHAAPRSRVRAPLLSRAPVAPSRSPAARQEAQKNSTRREGRGDAPLSPFESHSSSSITPADSPHMSSSPHPVSPAVSLPSIRRFMTLPLLLDARHRRYGPAPSGSRVRAPSPSLPSRRLPLQPARSLARPRRGNEDPGAAVALPGLLEPLATAAFWLPGNAELAVQADAVTPYDRHVRPRQCRSSFWHAGLGLSSRSAWAAVALSIVAPGLVYASYLTAEAVGYLLALTAITVGVNALESRSRVPRRCSSSSRSRPSRRAPSTSS